MGFGTPQTGGHDAPRTDPGSGRQRRLRRSGPSLEEIGNGLQPFAQEIDATIRGTGR